MRYFEVGDRIYGFCSGFFGRDDYENKICVYVTDTYAVFEYESDRTKATVLNYVSESESVKRWGNKDFFYNSTQTWKIKEEDNL